MRLEPPRRQDAERAQSWQLSSIRDECKPRSHGATEGMAGKGGVCEGNGGLWAGTKARRHEGTKGWGKRTPAYGSGQAPGREGGLERENAGKWEGGNGGRKEGRRSLAGQPVASSCCGLRIPHLLAERRASWTGATGTRPVDRRQPPWEDECLAPSSTCGSSAGRRSYHPKLWGPSDGSCGAVIRAAVRLASSSGCFGSGGCCPQGADGRPSIRPMKHRRAGPDCPGAEARPFLRWAGGKSKLVSVIAKYVPQRPLWGTYWEPFLGAGAMFFHLKPRHAVLSDLNRELVDCYKAVKCDPEGVARRLAQHRRFHGTDHYYRVRERYNRGGVSLSRAAEFIYLNKACFNGVFRVNTEGRFNVPWGNKIAPALPTYEELVGVSRALRGACLRCCDFTRILDLVTEGDFVYLDPPYPPLNGTAYFRHYTRHRFGPADQVSVANLFAALDQAGCFVLLSNAATTGTQRLYRSWRVAQIPVQRWVSCKGQRFLVNELVVRNY